LTSAVLLNVLMQLTFVLNVLQLVKL